jgi:hypothetical protein
VLRHARPPHVMRVVAERIAAKIGWPHSPFDDDYDFLSAYYAALRGAAGVSGC